MLSKAYLHKGMYAEALAVTKNCDCLEVAAMVHARAGRPAEARRILEQLERSEDASIHGAVKLARVYAALGRRDQAFAALEKVYQQRDY